MTSSFIPINAMKHPHHLRQRVGNSRQASVSIEETIAAIRRARVLVVGDVMLDRY